MYTRSTYLSNCLPVIYIYREKERYIGLIGAVLLS